jgi:hypothetical protein
MMRAMVTNELLLDRRGKQLICPHSDLGTLDCRDERLGEGHGATTDAGRYCLH